MHEIRNDDWVLFNKGGANYVYVSEKYPGKLLRVRKNISSLPRTKEVYEYMYSLGLNEYVVDSELVLLHPSIRQLLDGLRDDPYALLVTRLGQIGKPLKYSASWVTSGENGWSIEFKPKWLIHSPNYIKGKLCRTCALRKLRNNPSSFCPLDLASKDYNRVLNAVRLLCPIKQFEPQLVQFFLQTDVLEKLITLQKLDTKGIIKKNGEEIDNNFAKAMTARDVTMIINIEKNENENVDARLIDLDPKLYTGEKLQKLLQTEQAILDYWKS